MEKVAAGGSHFTINHAHDLIDHAKALFDKPFLRWRVGRGQLRAIHLHVLTASYSQDNRYESEHGFPSSGMFFGVPYYLDESVPDDEVYLERLVTFESVSVMKDLAVPSSCVIIRSSGTGTGNP